MVGFILCKQQGNIAVAVEIVVVQRLLKLRLGMMSMDDAMSFILNFLQDWFRTTIAPRPSITEPESRQDVQGRRDRTTIGDADFNQDILRICFGVFDKNIELTLPPLIAKAI